MFDFPANPSIGQPFVVAGITYIFDGVAWNVSAAPNTAVLTAQARNHIVNPSMQISQERGDAVGGSGWFPADMWLVGFAGVTAQAGRTFPHSDTASTYAVNVAVTVAKPSLAATDIVYMAQNIEGLNMTDFSWGTPQAKPAVLRFKAYTDRAGTYTFCLKNFAQTRTFLAPFTVPFGAWTEITIAIPPETTGVWKTDNTLAMYLNFNLAAGSTLGGGTAGWSAADKYILAGSTNFAGAVANIYISDVGLYVDPLATGKAPPYELPNFNDELARCSRYFNILYNLVVESSSFAMSTTFPYMRVSPTATCGNAGFTAAVVMNNSAQFYAASRAYGHVTLNARM